ncbi:NADP-dependent oxidoreductase domain-containing protein [Aspergillus spectabilis]
MALSSLYGKPLPNEQRVALHDKAYDLGVVLLGKWFQRKLEKRIDIFLATKFAVKTLANGATAHDSSPEYCRAACEKSLLSLGLPYVDLYYCHHLNSKASIEKTIVAMCSAQSLCRACKIHPISEVQIHTLDVAFVAYSPLGRGMMNGTLHSLDDFDNDGFRKPLPRFSKEKHKNGSPSQLILAWLIAQGHEIVAISGTTNLERLGNNIVRTSVQLSLAEEKPFREAVDAAEVQGEPYADAVASALFADTPALSTVVGP